MSQQILHWLAWSNVASGLLITIPLWLVSNHRTRKRQQRHYEATTAWLRHIAHKLEQ